MNSNMTSHPTVSLWQESLSIILRTLPAGTFISCFYLCFGFFFFLTDHGKVCVLVSFSGSDKIV